jgi:hypothetical protein
MDLQTRKIQFIQEFLKYANSNVLDKMEDLLRQERNKEFEKGIKPMTLDEYEHRIDAAFEDVKNSRVKNARQLKNEIATWK